MSETVEAYALKGDNTLTVTFRTHQVQNIAKSEAAKERVYDEMIVCDVRMPANRNNIPTFPAHSVSHWIEDPETGEKEAVTYAMRFSKQFQRFLNKQAQVQEGMPLHRVDGITDQEILELKALSIYTAEQLASLDGTALKNLGMKGRRLKNLAQAALDKDRKSQDALRAEIAELRAKLDAKEDATASDDPFSDKSDDDLKEIIKAKTGHGVRGNPKRETLVRMAQEAGALEAA